MCSFILQAKLNPFSKWKASFEVFLRSIIRAARFCRRWSSLQHPSEISPQAVSVLDLTRRSNDLHLPRVRTNWGKQTFIYQTSKDWNGMGVKMGVYGYDYSGLAFSYDAAFSRSRALSVSIRFPQLLVFHSVSTRAVITQFSGPQSMYGPLKFSV